MEPLRGEFSDELGVRARLYAKMRWEKYGISNLVKAS